MLTREEYLDAYKKFSKINTHYDYEKFESSFNYEETRALLDIHQNAESFNEGKWNFLYANFSDNKQVLYKMITSGYCPADILEKITNNTETIKNNITRSWDRPDGESDILASIAICDISKSLFDKIFPYVETTILSTFNNQYYSNKEKINNMSDTVIKNICDKLIEGYKPPASKKTHYISSSDVDHTVDVFQYIRDKEYIKEINQQDIHENIRTSLLNNKNLDPNDPKDAELMMQIYENGCVIENISNFTYEIKREISESLYEAFLTGFDETTGELKPKTDYIYYNAKSILGHLAEKNNLDEDIEYDLGMRLLDLKNRSTDQLVSAVFCNTKLPDLIRRIKDIKSGDKTTAYERNSNMPDDVLKERADELLTKMKKFIDKGQDRKIPDVWHEYLSNYCKKITFTPEQYSMLAVRAEKKLALNIATSLVTPKDDLIAFANRYADNAENWKAYLSGNILLGANTNLFCRENNISDKTTNNLMKYFVELPSSTTVEDINGKHYCNNLSYATQSIRALSEYCDKDERDKMYEYFKEYLSKPTISEKEKDLLEYTLAIMKEDIEKEQEFKMFDKESDVSKWSDRYFKSQIRELGKDFPWNQKDVGIIVALNKNYEKIMKFYDEAEKRGYFKEKEQEKEESR